MRFGPIDIDVDLVDDDAPDDANDAHPGAGRKYSPDLSELQQRPDDDYVPPLKTEVTKICGEVTVHQLPSRGWVSRNYIVSNVTQQILSRDLRRKRAVIWAKASTATVFRIGTREEVDAGTAGHWPALADDLLTGVAPVLELNHTDQVFARRDGDTDVVLTVIAEYWAD